MNMDEPITGPEDWRELAKLPVTELERQLTVLRDRFLETVWRLRAMVAEPEEDDT